MLPTFAPHSLLPTPIMMYTHFMRFSLFISLIFLISSCVARVPKTVENEENAVIIIDPLRIRAQEIASSMDDRLLVSQILISGTDGAQSMSAGMIELFTAIPTGGIMLFKYNLNAENSAIQAHLAEISSLIRQESGISPFFAVDHEGGTVNRFRRGVADLPSAQSYWELFQSHGKQAALTKIETDSLKAGKELFNLGINMNFAPVAETLFDGNRTFLASRSFGEDSLFTAEAASAFIRAMEQAGVLCVVKHFPASAGPDPHRSPSVLNIDKTELDKLVLPFTAVIKNGARAIMAAHTLATAVDKDKIASLSPVVMKNWLRDELGFDGLIISDDFTMAAAGNLNSEDAAVLSIIAGSDMILVWPGNLPKTYQAFMTALENGRLSRDRLQEAAQRIIYEKLKMGLVNNEELGVRSDEGKGAISN